MKVQSLISIASIAALSAAYQVTDGLIKSAGRELEFSQTEGTTVPVVFDDTTSKLDLSFKIIGSTEPDQVFIKVSNQDQLETSYKPIIKPTQGGYTAKLSLAYSKLPSLFKTSSSLNLALIVAGLGDSEPVFTTISGIELSEDLIAKGVAKYVKPDRFAPLPEIHHIFQTAPKTVNSGIALLFAALSVVSLFGLFIVWTGAGLINFKNFPASSGVVSHGIFISLIVGYEIVFFQYYLGSSIFSTIDKVFVLLGPTVYFGSKVLNYLGALRLAGKR